MKKLFSLLLLLVFSVYSTFPIWHILNVSLRSDNSFAGDTLHFWPETIGLVNYKLVLTKTLFPTWLENSVMIAVMVTLLGLLLSITAAYALSRFPIYGKKRILTFLLATQMFPATMLLLPFYILLSKLHLLNNFWGLLIIYSSSALPFCVWQLKGYFDTLPVEIEDAARVDGCTPWQVLWKIVIPISKPALAITALFNLTTSWSEYAIASVVLQDPSMQTLPLGLKGFQSSLATEWGLYTAAAVIVSLPATIAFVLLSRYLISGLTLGSVKG